MLIGIMSDSHDNLPALAKAVAYYNEKAVAAVLHAGDLISPFTAREMDKLTMPATITFGNNDGEKLGLRRVYGDRIHRPPYELTLDGRSVVMLHEPDNLDAVAASGHFDLVVYGHTHEIDVRSQPGLVVNPGECGGWVTGKSTVAVWDTSTDKIDIVEL
jgi:putative phosphoesterase